MSMVISSINLNLYKTFTTNKHVLTNFINKSIARRLTQENSY